MSQDRMEVEFRPDDAFADTILDEVVITGAHTFHAEMMGDDHLWIGISNEAGHLVHVNVRVEQKGRKAAIVMRGEDQGEHPRNDPPEGWITVEDRMMHLEAENARLRIAFHDAIRRPLGVTPDSGAEFYNARVADEAEARRPR